MCDLCHSVVFPHGIQSCKCGNIKGAYSLNDRRTVIVAVKDKSSSRIIGIPNGVRYGLVDRHECWVIPWNDEYVKVVEKLGEENF